MDVTIKKPVVQTGTVDIQYFNNGNESLPAYAGSFIVGQAPLVQHLLDLVFLYISQSFAYSLQRSRQNILPTK